MVIHSVDRKVCDRIVRLGYKVVLLGYRVVRLGYRVVRLGYRIVHNAIVTATRTVSSVSGAQWASSAIEAPGRAGVRTK